MGSVSTLRIAGVLGGAGLVCLQAGCLSRHLSITSEPSGARVWLNDIEIGRTPIEAEFTHFGDYSVRLERDGYEPLQTHKRAWAPWYEYPPIDLVVTALPIPVETEIDWHFELSPRTSEGDEGVEDRAREMRQRTADEVGGGTSESEQGAEGG